MKLQYEVFVSALSAAIESLGIKITVETQTGSTSAQRLGSGVSATPLPLSVVYEFGQFVINAKYIDGVYVADGTDSVDQLMVDFFKTLNDAPGAAESAALLFRKTLADAGVVTDDQVLDFAKSLADAAYGSDFYTFALSKPLAELVASAEDKVFLLAKKVREDAAGATDAINSLDVGKGLNDTPTAGESHAIASAKTLSDDAAALSQTSLHPTKVFEDTVDGVGDYAVLYAKKAADNFAFLGDGDYQFDVSKSLSDVGGASDEPEFSYAKLLVDTGSATDNTYYFGVSKTLEDAVSFTDDVDGNASILDDQEMQFFKNRTDVAGVSESIHILKTYLRYFDESVPAADLYAAFISKPFFEAASVSDVRIAEYGLGKADGLSLAETHVIDAFKPFSDSWTAADTYVSSYGSVKSDNYAVSEDSIFSFNKPLSDSWFVSEAISLGHGKPRSDSAFISEDTTVVIGKAHSETTSATDAGSLRSQGFSDFTYFAEDYVGASRTF